MSSGIWGGAGEDKGAAAFICFLRDVCGWDSRVLKRFKIFEDLFQSCWCVWWTDDVVAISDRPLEIQRDDVGRLHNEIGPSVVFRDGWSLHHWHGVLVPSEWIRDRSSLTPLIALTQENIEQRRAACEILGWAKVLGQLDATLIDHDDDPMIGDLLEVNLPDFGNAKFLKVVCGTGRTFALPVPPESRTALEANAWTYGIDPIDYRNLEVRT